MPCSFPPGNRTGQKVSPRQAGHGFGRSWVPGEKCQGKGSTSRAPGVFSEHGTAKLRPRAGEQMLRRVWLPSLCKGTGADLLGVSEVREQWEPAGMGMAQGVSFVPSKSHPGT